VVGLDDKDVPVDRSLEFPEKEFVKALRILESARDGGTTFRAIGAFSQTVWPCPEKLLTEWASPADRFPLNVCQPVLAEFRAPDGGPVNPRPAGVPPKECHCPSAVA
jgi:hypothetical protein